MSDVDWLDTGRPLRLRCNDEGTVDHLLGLEVVQDASMAMWIGGQLDEDGIRADHRVRVVGIDGLGDYRLHMEAGQAFVDWLHDHDFWGPTYRVLLGWADDGTVEAMDWVGSDDHAQLPVRMR